MPTAEREELLRLLRQDAVKQINFWCFGLHVDKAFYDRVTSKIANGDVSAVAAPDTLGKQGAAAGYNASDNTMLLGKSRLSNLLDETQALHECTHTGMDIMQFAVRWYYEEAICYIAQGCFVVGKLGSGACPAWIHPGDRLYGLGQEIACSVRPGGEVDWGPFVELAQAVKYHPGYKKELADWGDGPGTTDGVKTRWY